jgi:hypothetical protein
VDIHHAGWTPLKSVTNHCTNHDLKKKNIENCSPSILVSFSQFYLHEYSVDSDLFSLFSLCFYFIFTTNHSAAEVDVQSRALNLGRQGHFEISRYCHNLKFLPA